MIKVVCVLKTGGDFDPDYVYRLKAAVARNLKQEHRFICLTDLADDLGWSKRDILAMPLEDDLPMWWSKMEAFKIHGPALYFDLDTVILRSLNPLARWLNKGSKAMLLLNGFKRNVDASGIMAWNGNKSILNLDFMLHTKSREFIFANNALRMRIGKTTYRGDQEWISEAVRKRYQMPVVYAQEIVDGIISFKNDFKMNGGLPPGTRIVCFHGRPRPRDAQALPFMRKHWAR